MKQAARPLKAWLRLAVNTCFGVIAAQLSTLGFWMIYLLLAFFVEGKNLDKLPLFPIWLLIVSVVSMGLAVGVNLHQFWQGHFDKENPMLKSRRSFRREQLSRHRQLRKAKAAGLRREGAGTPGMGLGS